MLIYKLNISLKISNNMFIYLALISHGVTKSHPYNPNTRKRKLEI